MARAPGKKDACVLVLLAWAAGLAALVEGIRWIA